MTLTAEGCRTRRAELFEATDADLVVLANPRHVFYFSGFRSSEMSLAGWGPVYLIMDRERGATLLGQNLARAAVEAAPVERAEVWTWYNMSRHAGVPIWREGVQHLRDMLAELTTGRRGLRVGFESGTLPVDAMPAGHGCELHDITDAVIRARRRKYPDELSLIERAVAIAHVGHTTARRVLSPGMSEIELYAEMLKEMTIAAGEAVNFISDVVSGPRCRHGGGQPTDRRIQDGDAVILDLNPYVGGYRADYTATIILRETLTDAESRLEQALHAALVAGEAMLRPGLRAADVFAAADRAVREAGYEDGLTHHAGHGLGLGHPEAPYFVPQSDEVLVEGDVVTLEPGLYQDEAQGRIEHNYLVTADGPRRLSTHSTAFLVAK